MPNTAWMLPNGEIITLDDRTGTHFYYLVEHPEMFGITKEELNWNNFYVNNYLKTLPKAYAKGALRLTVIKRIPPILIVEGLQESIESKKDKLMDFSIDHRINTIEMYYVNKEGETMRKKELDLSEEYAYAKNKKWHKKAQQERVMILIRSPAGAGKSTLAKQLAGDTGVILESDEFFMQQGKYMFDIDKQIEAHHWNQDRCLEAMKNGISPIVIANTNTQAMEAEHYVRMAIGHGYKIRIEEPSWHKDLKDPSTGKWNFDFLKGRNLHGVPDDVLKKMIDRYENKDEFVRKLKEMIAGK